MLDQETPCNKEQQLDLFPVTTASAEEEISLSSRMQTLLQHIDKITPDMQRALKQAGHTHTVDDVVAMILAGNLLYWPLPNSFLVTEIQVFPRKKFLHIFLAGGMLSEITAMQSALVEAARMNGCAALTISGRPGWLKALQPLGWKAAHTSMIFNV